jgi:predicted nucleic acid-binding protein
MIESEEENARRRFVVDTNVFVSAIKPFSKRSGKGPTDTGSLALLVMLITDPELELFGSLWLFDEYKRLAEELSSKTGELILGRLTAKMREVAEIGEDVVARCRPYLPEPEAADVLHAATCLQSKAVLITNDRDFDRIKESGVIEVWSISEAIRKLSIQGWHVSVV